jgi:hypothetical protein
MPVKLCSQTPSPPPPQLPCSAHGYVFDQAAFIAAHKRKDKLAAFLAAFRNSQMLEVFVTERLKLASEGYVTEDPFELKVGQSGGSAAAAVRARLLSGRCCADP